MAMVISNVRQAMCAVLPAMAIGLGCASIVDLDKPVAMGETAARSVAATGASGGSSLACANPVTSMAMIVADTAVSPDACRDGPKPQARCADPSRQCGASAAGDARCLDLTSENQIHGLIRFSLDGAAAAAIAKPGALLSAKLTITPEGSCGGKTFLPSGKLDAWVMRSDWDERDARWCHRDGPSAAVTDVWGMPGANDPATDFGGLVGSITLPSADAPFTIDLDPQAISASSRFVVSNEISFRLVAEPGATLAMATRERNPKAPPVLVVQYCP